MLVGMKELLQAAMKGKYAVGAFNITGLENLIAVTNAAEKEKKPVILQYADVHRSYISIEEIGPVMLQFAQKASIPVAVHFDHGSSFESCMKAMQLGFTSVMYDGSGKSFDINIKETAEVVRAAHALGVSVEAELGTMLNSELGAGEGAVTRSHEDYDNPDDYCTSPAMAREFAERTGIDALAISFGTMHGVYLKAPVLRLERIREIKQKIDIPFVMHGGSGVSEADVRTAIRYGITKINYYTYMAMAGGSAVAEFIARHKDDMVFFHDISCMAIEAMQKDVQTAMQIFAKG